MKKLTYEYVKKYIESFGYKLLSEKYKDNRTPLTMICPENHEINISFGNFKNKNRRCRYCQKKKVANQIKTSYEEVKEHIESFGYELISKEYINAHEYIIVKPPCGHEEYKITFAAFKYQNQRCPKCANEHRNDNRKATYDYVKEYIESFGYKLLSEEYIDSKQNILIQCPHKHEYEVNFGNFQQGRRCPKCNESKGEKEITNILERYNIEYLSQHKFEKCKLQRHLPFDFYLPDYNCCIEFDGEQHYRIVEYWGGLDSFISRVIRDTIKNKYCEDNNIKLIRIRYDQIDNIKQILIDELNL